FYEHFFFSSRRRHTRSKRDWSSDVCSSDLALLQLYSTVNLSYLQNLVGLLHNHLLLQFFFEAQHLVLLLQLLPELVLHYPKIFVSCRLCDLRFLSSSVCTSYILPIIILILYLHQTVDLISSMSQPFVA